MNRRTPNPHHFREEASPYRASGSAEPGTRRFIDLFCGCGGFTLGMQRAGFQCLAAIDSNAKAVATLKANLPETEHILERDLTRFAPAELAQVIGTDSVDVIVGGPPCQGFSRARQVDGSNHGARLKADPRRFLYREFLRYVDFFQPRVFVMENVLGLRTASGGEYFTAVQKESRALGYRVHGQIEDAWELGVPQKRRRQLIIGVRNDLPGYFLPQLEPAPRAEPRTWLWAAIGDLPILRAGGGGNEREYDFGRRNEHVEQQGRTALRYLCEVLEIDRAQRLANHISRPHSERDLRDFARLHEGESSATAMRARGVEFEFPYDKSSFKDRYTRQSRWHPCSTIVAHLSKDGLMFIHPTQNRSLTPREAARIQSFPDWFRFPEARTQAYRLIGNAVPPLVAEAVGLAARHFLETGGCPQPSSTAPGNTDRTHSWPASASREPARTFLPLERLAAARELERLAQLDRHAIRALPGDDFLRGWHALLFLFPDLHPDNALDHGDAVETWQDSQLPLPGLEFFARRYARTGWPVALELIGREAWRRHEAHETSRAEFYCAEAQRAGLKEKSRELARP